MVKYEQPQVTEPEHKGNLELLTRYPFMSLPEDVNPDLRAKFGDNTDNSDDQLEDVDAKLAEPSPAEKYKPWISSKDREYTSDDHLINESETILISPKSEIEEIVRHKPLKLRSYCCVREDFQPTWPRVKGILLAILFYGNLVTGWMLAITWAKIAVRSNWWLPMCMMGSLVASGLCCSRVVCLWDRWRGSFGWCWTATIITDILGLSMIKVLAVEWRTKTKMKACQDLSNISSLSSYMNFLITSFCLAVSSSEDLMAFEPTPLIWVCWLMAFCSLGAIDTVEDEDEEDEDWDRNFERLAGLMLELTFILIGICTPLIYVCWWPNAGLYGIVFGTLFFICAISWDLDESKHVTPAIIFGITVFLIVLGLASVQLYIATHETFTGDAHTLAAAGGAVAGAILGFAYIYIGCFAVEMVISILRSCNFHMRDL